MNRNLTELCIKFLKSCPEIYYSLHINSKVGCCLTHETVLILVKEDCSPKREPQPHTHCGNILKQHTQGISHLFTENLSRMQKTPILGLLSVMPQIKFQRKSAGFVVSKTKTINSPRVHSQTLPSKKLFLNMAEVTNMEKL